MSETDVLRRLEALEALTQAQANDIAELRREILFLKGTPRIQGNDFESSSSSLQATLASGDASPAMRKLHAVRERRKQIENGPLSKLLSTPTVQSLSRQSSLRAHNVEEGATPSPYTPFSPTVAMSTNSTGGTPPTSSNLQWKSTSAGDPAVSSGTPPLVPTPTPPATAPSTATAPAPSSGSSVFATAHTSPFAVPTGANNNGANASSAPVTSSKASTPAVSVFAAPATETTASYGSSNGRNDVTKTLSSLARRHTLDVGTEVLSAAFVDNSTFVCGTIDGGLIVWQSPNAVEKEWPKAPLLTHKQGHAGSAINAMCVINDADEGTLLATVSDDTNAKLWKLDATGADNDGVPELYCMATLMEHTGEVMCVATFNGQVQRTKKQQLLTGSADNSIIVWATDSQRPVRTLLGHENAVMAIACVGDVNAYSSSSDGIRVWNVLNGTCDHVIVAPALNFLRFDGGVSGGRVGVSGDASGTVRTWRVDGNGLLSEVATLLGHDGDVFWGIPLTDSTALSGGADGTVRLWDTSAGFCLSCIGSVEDEEAGSDAVNAIVPVPGRSNWVLCTVEDGTIAICEAL